jgi:hypothetical protein
MVQVRAPRRCPRCEPRNVTLFFISEGHSMWRIVSLLQALDEAARRQPATRPWGIGSVRQSYQIRQHELIRVKLAAEASASALSLPAFRAPYYLDSLARFSSVGHVCHRHTHELPRGHIVDALPRAPLRRPPARVAHLLLGTMGRAVQADE